MVQLFELAILVSGATSPCHISVVFQHQVVANQERTLNICTDMIQVLRVGGDWDWDCQVFEKRLKFCQNSEKYLNICI